MIVTGLSAAILDAEIHCNSIRPGGMRINQRPMIKWSEASEELKQNPNAVWMKIDNNERYIYRELTKEEKEEIKLNKQYKLNSMFKYILKYYGWQTAVRFYKDSSWSKKFEKLEVAIDLRFPHCKYNKMHQCDLKCPFFDKQCTYEGEL
jgi:hypothetical protein